MGRRPGWLAHGVGRRSGWLAVGVAGGRGGSLAPAAGPGWLAVGG